MLIHNKIMVIGKYQDVAIHIISQSLTVVHAFLCYTTEVLYTASSNAPNSAVFGCQLIKANSSESSIQFTVWTKIYLFSLLSKLSNTNLKSLTGAVEIFLQQYIYYRDVNVFYIYLMLIQLVYNCSRTTDHTDVPLSGS